LLAFDLPGAGHWTDGSLWLADERRGVLKARGGHVSPASIPGSAADQKGIYELRAVSPAHCGLACFKAELRPFSTIPPPRIFHGTVWHLDLSMPSTRTVRGPSGWSLVED